jgi:DNA-binding MarR family transcriptional regulator
MRSHVPDAIGLTFRILRLSVANVRRLACLTFRPEGLIQRGPAAAMDIDTSALVRALDLLEKASYICRKLDPTDRRLKRIFLTDGDRAAWETCKQTT